MKDHGKMIKDMEVQELMLGLSESMWADGKKEKCMEEANLLYKRQKPSMKDNSQITNLSKV